LARSGETFVSDQDAFRAFYDALEAEGILSMLGPATEGKALSRLR